MANLFYKERLIITSSNPAWVDISWQDEFGRHSHIIRNPIIKTSSERSEDECISDSAKKSIDPQSKDI